MFFFDGRNPSRYKTRAGALMEHFLKTLVHLKKPIPNDHQIQIKPF